MKFQDDYFYVGNVPMFMAIIKLIKMDPEFRIAFDFSTGAIEMESMMIGGVVGLGIRLKKCADGVFVPSPTVRVDRVVFRVDTVSFFRTVVGLNQVPYAYMSLSIQDSDILIETYRDDHVRLGTATINTLTLEEDDVAFPVTENTIGANMAYEATVVQTGTMWRQYIQASTVDTMLRYDPIRKGMTVETRNQQSTMSLYLPVPGESEHGVSGDVVVCLMPSVVSILRSVLQVTDKFETRVSISDDLPIMMFATLDKSGSSIRTLAGTKEPV
jgi:hypothetical protein